MKYVLKIFILWVCTLPLAGNLDAAPDFKNTLQGVAKNIRQMPPKINRNLTAPIRKIAAQTLPPSVKRPTAAIEANKISNSQSAHLKNSLQRSVTRLMKQMQSLRTHVAAQKVPVKKPVPAEEKAFVTSDFFPFLYSGKEIPTLPFALDRKHIYRGLGLPADGPALRRILQEGLLVKDVGPDNNSLRMSYASVGGLAALKQVAQKKVINLTDSPVLAFNYAWRNRHKGIMVLLSVRNFPYHGNIVVHDRDIPAADLEEAIVLLQVDGTPHWCKVQVLEQGFQITPYVEAK